MTTHPDSKNVRKEAHSYTAGGNAHYSHHFEGNLVILTKQHKHLSFEQAIPLLGSNLKIHLQQYENTYAQDYLL